MEQDIRPQKKFWLSALILCLIALALAIFVFPSNSPLRTGTIYGSIFIGAISIIMLGGCCIKNPLPEHRNHFNAGGPHGD